MFKAYRSLEFHLIDNVDATKWSPIGEIVEIPEIGYERDL